MSKIEASAYSALIAAGECLAPQLYYADGTKVEESRASKHLGQYKERRGARKDVSTRFANFYSDWHLLKPEPFRCKRLAVKLGIRLY